jgi:integrase/recombinase XerD
LLKEQQIQQNPCSFLKIRGTKQQTLFRIYTNEELTNLYDTFYLLFVKTYDFNHIPKNQRKQSTLSKERNAVILNILIHQALRTREINAILLQDLDLMNATLKIRGAKQGKERTLTLQATQIGVLMNYLQNIRPELLHHQSNQESEKLFLSLPEYSKQKTESTSIMHLFKPLVKQLKSIDKNFLSFEQIRTSIITNWLKVHGLRKTQVMAGHRQISTTEKYKTSDLQQLTDDINKLHPF